MDYSKRIKDLREKANLTQEKLALLMGLETPNFISQIETGRKRVGLSVISKFCGALGIELWEFFREQADVVEASRNLPVIELSGATTGGCFDACFNLLPKSVRYRIQRPADIRDEHAYGVLVNGDGMAPALNDRDMIIVSPSQKYRSGDTSVVGLASGEVLLRKIRPNEKFLLLESCNPAVEARVVNSDDVKFVHPVVWVRYRMPLSLMAHF